MVKRMLYILAFCCILATTGIWFYIQVDKIGTQQQSAQPNALSKLTDTQLDSRPET